MIRDVYFDPNEYKTKSNMIKLQNGMKQGLDSHGEDACCLILNKFTSTTTSFNVALKFAKPTSTKDGLVFEISSKHLCKHGELVFCDISWISQFPDECEILIAPCMLNIHPIDFPQQKKSNIKIVRADVAAIKPIPQIMKP